MAHESGPSEYLRTGVRQTFQVLQRLLSLLAISLPLQGYYRPGFYMPVRTDSATTIPGADGIFPTSIEMTTDSITPVLIYGSPSKLSPTLNIRPLPNGERLIAFDGDAQKFAQGLFPNEKIISIPIDPANPLPGPSAAWEALDAIILDSQAMSRLDDSHRSAFLAAGVILAVPSDVVPDSRWPWKRQGELWLLRYEPLGPAGQLIDPAVFSPTYAWAPGSSAELKAEVMISGVLLGICVIAIAMWRSKFAFGGIIFLAGISTVVSILWRQRMEIVNRAGGDVLIVSDALLQRDSWLYERGRSPGNQRIEWEGNTHPMLASISQMRIVMNEAGHLAFEYQVVPGKTVAFMRRDVLLGPVPITSPSHTSPMQDLAKDAYLSPGHQMAGEVPAIDGHWNTVVIENIKQTSDR
jgi:hypothetical protein